MDLLGAVCHRVLNEVVVDLIQDAPCLGNEVFDAYYLIDFLPLGTSTYLLRIVLRSGGDSSCPSLGRRNFPILVRAEFSEDDVFFVALCRLAYKITAASGPSSMRGLPEGYFVERSVVEERVPTTQRLSDQGAGRTSHHTVSATQSDRQSAMH